MRARHASIILESDLTDVSHRPGSRAPALSLALPSPKPQPSGMTWGFAGGSTATNQKQQGKNPGSNQQTPRNKVRDASFSASTVACTV